MAETRRAALKEAVARLKSAGLETPVLDARLIVQHALGVDWEALFLGPDLPLSACWIGSVWTRRWPARLAREPVSRIVGRRHFWTLELAVTPATLDPRSDTETVIEAALAAIPDRSRPLRLLDLGTGTGALLLALLAELPQRDGHRGRLLGRCGRESRAPMRKAVTVLPTGPKFGLAIGGARWTSVSTLLSPTRPTSRTPNWRRCRPRYGTTIRFPRWMAGPTGSTPIARSFRRCRASRAGRRRGPGDRGGAGRGGLAAGGRGWIFQPQRFGRRRTGFGWNRTCAGLAG